MASSSPGGGTETGDLPVHPRALKASLSPPSAASPGPGCHARLAAGEMGYAPCWRRSPLRAAPLFLRKKITR